MGVDRLWYGDKTQLNADAEAIAKAAEEYLLSEARGLGVPEPEVEEAVRSISDDASPWLQSLAGRDVGPVRASAITWRHIAAQNCHQFERARYEDRPVGDDGRTTKSVKVSDEDDVNAWIRKQSDAVVMGLIRENALWLRNAAVADRICQWRLDMSPYLRELAGLKAGKGRGRPEAGPRFPSGMLHEAFLTIEREHQHQRNLWCAVREGAGSAPLLELGAEWWRQLHGWDRVTVAAWERKAGSALFQLTPEQAVKHLASHLVIVRDANDDRTRWVTIDDNGWPRAAAVALCAARCRVSKGWLLKRIREK